MFNWITRKLRGNPSGKNDLLGEWDARVKTQYESLPKAGFFPVPEEVLEASNRRYRDTSHRSFAFSDLNLINQSMIFPVRALYATGATLITSEDQFGRNPSLVIENACRFRLAAMEAALNATPNDLLVLLSVLPQPESWEQSREWQESNLPSEHFSVGWHSTYRHAVVLFLKRIDTPAADFLAFKEAASVLGRFGLFCDEKDEDGNKRERLGYVISDVFPSLRRRERELLDRKLRLAWRSEDATDPVVPEDNIGLNGFV